MISLFCWQDRWIAAPPKLLFIHGFQLSLIAASFFKDDASNTVDASNTIHLFHAQQICKKMQLIPIFKNEFKKNQI